MLRRRFLKLAGTAAVAPALGTALQPFDAAAQQRQLVVMTWGGLWGDAMRDNIDAAFQKRAGAAVIQDRGSSPVERITKLKVGLADQKVDLVQLADGLVPLAVKQGVLEKLDRNSPRMPNLRNMIPQFWNDHWVPQIFSVIGVTYNTKLVKTPPTGFADLWRPEFKGRIVLPEISHSIGPYIIPLGAMAVGKSPKDEAAGFEQLKRLTELRPIWVKDTDSIMNAYRDEEGIIGLLYKSQTFTVQGWKTPVEWVYPKEGGVPFISGTGIAKGTKNLELAEAYLDVTMDPETQPAFTKLYNYPGTNKDMIQRLTPELQERARFPQDQLDRLVTLDQAWMSDRRADWTDRWNRIVAGG